MYLFLQHKKYNHQSVIHRLIGWYIDRFKTGAGVCMWGSRRGHSFNLGLHTTVFQAEIYAIKACVMGSIEYR
jgi:hypothetical protein